MEDEKRSFNKFRIRNLKLKNFKVFDDFEIEFPPPQMKNDPDVMVIGSANGLGKTSILEACAILLYCGLQQERLVLPNFFIRAGTTNAQIKGTFEYNEQSYEITVDLKKNHPPIQKGIFKFLYMEHTSAFTLGRVLPKRFLNSLMGLSSDPIVLPLFIYLHSYRKIHEEKPELSAMFDKNYDPNGMKQTSLFKREILNALMGSANLVEQFSSDDAADVLSKLNELLKQYAKVSIGKIRIMKDNAVDLRITPSKGGESFSFDALSSGQKEIISSLFLLWHYTKDKPSIVLIDEPELHLNVKWHRNFLQQATKIAPNNQYIIATHSEDIASSVEKHQCRLIVPDDEA
ncbi:ATP-binding protein [Candidatus Magnetoovum chiemensis]|nr:ATP-binding protein [Candidatus Magnetoovum chiemensis]